eukprot:7106-Heterococcus_DN1.PRE.2
MAIKAVLQKHQNAMQHSNCTIPTNSSMLQQCCVHQQFVLTSKRIQQWLFTQSSANVVVLISVHQFSVAMLKSNSSSAIYRCAQISTLLSGNVLTT